jgi:pimeloyl-ACP methyl ester carboxylesterase
MAKKQRKRKFRFLKPFGAVLKAVNKLCLRTFRILTIPVFSPITSKREEILEEKRPIRSGRKSTRWSVLSLVPVRKVVNGVIMRLLAAPVLILFCIFIIVYSSVHPGPQKAIGFSPEGMGLYYEPVLFTSQDGTNLSGWYIPSINAQEVLAEGDKALTRQRPGAVLCHGIGANRRQLITLAMYLNSHGVDVMLFDFRSAGLSSNAPRSFGINERNDVLAAAHTLAAQSSVDPTRVFLVGQDMGGVASLWACGSDPTIAGLVIADVHTDFKKAVESRVGKEGALTKLATDAYVLGCKVFFHANDKQFSSVHAASLLSPRQALMVITREKNESLNQATMQILQRTKAKSQKVVVDKVQSCLLNDIAVIAPTVLEFISRDRSEEQAVLSASVQ